MPDIHITQKGVEKLLTNLNPNKATGPDGLSPRILKELSSQIAPILTKIFQMSLETGEIPDDWRTANVSPIFKKGEKYNPANYRLVSLTCICSKIMEHILVSNIMTHLAEHDILYQWQHGFRSKRSMETQLLTFIHKLSQNLDRKKQTDIAILDFSKAFDKAPHSRLALKLNHYCLRKCPELDISFSFKPLTACSA